jgi:hypothetical protein
MGEKLGKKGEKKGGKKGNCDQPYSLVATREFPSSSLRFGSKIWPVGITIGNFETIFRD